MVGLITAQLGEAGDSDMDLDDLPSSFSERVDPLDTAKLFARSIGNTMAEYGTTDDYGRPTSAPEPAIDADVLNQKWGIKGNSPESSLTFSASLPESVAQDMNAAKRDEIARANAGQRIPGGFGSVLADFGFGMLDPVGIAASALPVFGEARMASLLGRAGVDLGEGALGQVGLRAATGVADATAANVPLVGARFVLSQQEQSDYSMTDAARDLAFGALLGGVLHPVIGATTDALHALMGRTPAVAALDDNPDLRAATSAGGVAAAMEDRPFDVAPFADLAQARAEREELWFRLSRDSEALQSEIGGIQDSAPADPVTAERLEAIQTELAQPDVTAERRGELAQEASMLTEGTQPTPEADALFAARSGSQRDGLQIALERNRQRIADIESSIYQSDTARRAAGALDPEDAAVMQQADAAAKVAPAKLGALPPEITKQIAKLEADLGRVRSGGVEAPTETAEGGAPIKEAAPPPIGAAWAPEHEAELTAATEAEQASQARSNALLQAGACVARGLF